VSADDMVIPGARVDEVVAGAAEQGVVRAAAADGFRSVDSTAGEAFGLVTDGLEQFEAAAAEEVDVLGVVAGGEFQSGVEQQLELVGMLLGETALDHLHTSCCPGRSVPRIGRPHR
jgi:hypothetical protein